MTSQKGIFCLNIQPHTFRICWIHDNASIHCLERVEEAIHYLFTPSANSDQPLQLPALSFFIKQKSNESPAAWTSVTFVWLKVFLQQARELKKKKICVVCPKHIFLFRKLCEKYFCLYFRGLYLPAPSIQAQAGKDLQGLLGALLQMLTSCNWNESLLPLKGAM